MKSTEKEDHLMNPNLSNQSHYNLILNRYKIQLNKRQILKMRIQYKKEIQLIPIPSK